MNYGIRRFDAGGDAGGGGDTSIVAAPAPAPAPAPAASTTSKYTQQQINDALRTELAARPGTTYYDMMRFGQQQYGLSPQQVQTAYDALQPSITPYNTPQEGGIYSFAPAAYQPVRYTPTYDQYGQGIASLFGRGYSQYFQPPGLTGTYYFGSQPGGGPTYVPPGGDSTTRDTTGTTLTGTDKTKITTVTRPEGLTDAQFARYQQLAPTDQGTYTKIAGYYNAPGNVQSDAAAIAKYMADNKLSVADAARLIGKPGAEGEQIVRSYLGQAGLTDAQLGRYQTIGATDQGTYAKLAGAFNAPGNVASDAAQMRAAMTQNKLSTADVARITGIPENAVISYLGQEGLNEAQLQRYQQLGAADQATYGSLAKAFNLDYATGALNKAFGSSLSAPLQSTNYLKTAVQEQKLSPTEVSRITGVPLADVYAALGMTAPAPAPAPPPPSGITSLPTTTPAPAPARPAGFNQGVYNYVQANVDNPQAVYNAMVSSGADTGALATALGIPESQVIAYFDNAGVTSGGGYEGGGAGGGSA